MARDFFPRPDAEAIRFTANFSDHINADPARYHLTAERAAEYAVLQAAFADAYQRTQSPSTNSTTATVAKRMARVPLEVETRRLVAMIKVNSGIAPDVKMAAGVKERRKPTRIGKPQSAPKMFVRSVVGRTVTLDLRDAESGKRKKPTGVSDLTVFSAVGYTPPQTREGWKFVKNTTVTRTSVNFADTLAPGTRVWLCAYWSNRRFEQGPACAPVYAHVGYGLSLPKSLKAAA
jgi:hypothetical protein